jgi:hypothetical protein
MSISNNYDCIELTELSKVLYNTDYNTSNCAMLSDLNNIVKNDNPIKLTSVNNFNNLENYFKIFDYSGSPIYILVLITIITNLFLALPLIPVFIAGFLYVIILILILAALCISLIYFLLFQK